MRPKLGHGRGSGPWWLHRVWQFQIWAGPYAMKVLIWNNSRCFPYFLASFHPVPPWFHHLQPQILLSGTVTWLGIWEVELMGSVNGASTLLWQCIQVLHNCYSRSYVPLPLHNRSLHPLLTGERHNFQECSLIFSSGVVTVTFHFSTGSFLVLVRWCCSASF